MLPDSDPGPSSAETLDGIGAAFGAALRRNASPEVIVPVALISAALLGLFVLRLRRYVEFVRAERQNLDVHHAAAMASAREVEEKGGNRRQWVRVKAHLRLCLQRSNKQDRVSFENFETVDLSAGGVSFLAFSPPPVGSNLQFDLHIGDQWPMLLRGVVQSVKPPAGPQDASLVVLKFGPIKETDREHIARWVAQEDAREAAEAKRGRLCKRCGIPLPDDASEMHSTCASGRPGPRTPES